MTKCPSTLTLTKEIVNLLRTTELSSVRNDHPPPPGHWGFGERTLESSSQWRSMSRQVKKNPTYFMRLVSLRQLLPCN